MPLDPSFPFDIVLAISTKKDMTRPPVPLPEVTKSRPRTIPTFGRLLEMPTPWSAISKLKVKVKSPFEARQALQLATMVQEAMFFIDTVDCQPPNGWKATPVPCPDLRYLAIRVLKDRPSGPVVLGALFGNLRAKRLKTLVVPCNFVTARSFHFMVKRVQGSLKNLSLTPSSFRSEAEVVPNILSLLRKTIILKNLQIKQQIENLPELLNTLLVEGENAILVGLEGLTLSNVLFGPDGKEMEELVPLMKKLVAARFVAGPFEPSNPTKNLKTLITLDVFTEGGWTHRTGKNAYHPMGLLLNGWRTKDVFLDTKYVFLACQMEKLLVWLPPQDLKELHHRLPSCVSVFTFHGLLCLRLILY